MRKPSVFVKKINKKIKPENAQLFHLPAHKINREWNVKT